MRALPVDDAVAGGACASARAASCRYGLSSGRASTDIGGSTSACASAVQLPEPEVAGEDDRALAGGAAPRGRARRPRTRPSARIWSGVSVLTRSTVDEQPAEMRERLRARSRGTPPRSARETPRAAARRPAADARRRRVERQADAVPRRATADVGQHADDAAHARRRPRTRGGGAAIGAASRARLGAARASSHARNSSAGSIDDLERHRPRPARAAAGAAAAARRPSRS